MALARWILIVALLLETVSSFALEAADTLAAALHSYRERGLEVVFSSALVRPDMRVTVAPASELSLDAQVQALLSPHGLALEHHGSGIWVVVRAKPPNPNQPPPADRPRISVPEEIRVTASRYRLERTTSSTVALDRRQLEAIPAIGADAFRKVSALPGSASLGVSARQRLRGGDEDETLFLVDGIEVVEPFHLKDFQALFGAIPSSAIDRVDVYTGGFPVGYGGRLSGVVDLTLGRGRDPSEANEVDLNPLAASVTASAEDPTGLDWLFAGRRGLLDQVSKALERDPGRPMFHDELLRLRYANDTDEARIGIMNVEDEVQLTKDDDEERGDSDYTNRLVWLGWRHQWSPTIDTDTTLSQTAIANELSGQLTDVNDALGALEDERDVSVWRLRSTTRVEASRDLVFSMGFDTSRQDVDATADLAATYGPLRAPLGSDQSLARSVRIDRADTLVGVFLATHASVLDERLSIDAGLRLDDQEAGTVNDRHWSPRIGASLLLTRRFDVYINLGRFVQQQNTYELQLGDGELEVQHAQRSDQSVLGLSWRPTPSTQWRVEGYDKRIDSPRARFSNIYDPYVLLPELHADRIELNPARARAHGVETKFTYRADATDITASYAWSHAEEEIQGTWHPRPWDQRHAARLGVSRETAAYRLSAAITWHSGWPRTDRANGALTPGSLYSDHFPDYLSIDLNASRRFDVGRTRIDVYLDVVNALDRQNEGGFDYDLVGNGWIEDPANLVSLIPTLGLRIAW